MSGFFGLPVWAIILIILFILCAVVGAFAILLKFLKDKNGDLMINKNGLIVRAKSPKLITTKQFINFLKETIIYVENEKERYVDDIIGIKNRFFRQSKDFAKSRIESVKNSIIEEYKIEYMKTYSGQLTPYNENGDIINSNVILPTKEQISETRQHKSPCSSFCSAGCNSGLAFFDSRIQKDFKPILEEVYKIIEENHLINRADREYEEEITTKAEQLSTYLKNVIISYPVPIDNHIAKMVIDKKCHDVKEAIADSLRRSRTLSQKKREAINQEKDLYYKKRNIQISQIINIIDDEDLNKILARTDKFTVEDSDC